MVASTVSLSPQRLVVANFHQRIVMSVQTPSFLSHLALHTLAFTPLLHVALPLQVHDVVPIVICRRLGSYRANGSYVANDDVNVALLLLTGA